MTLRAALFLKTSSRAAINSGKRIDHRYASQQVIKHVNAHELVFGDYLRHGGIERGCAEGLFDAEHHADDHDDGKRGMPDGDDGTQDEGGYRQAGVAGDDYSTTVEAVGQHAAER